MVANDYRKCLMVAWSIEAEGAWGLPQMADGLLLEGAWAHGSTGLGGRLMLFRPHQAGAGSGGDDNDDEVGGG